MTRLLAVGRDAAEVAAFAGGTLARIAGGGGEAFAAAAPWPPSDGAAGDGIAAAFREELGATWLGSARLAAEDGRPARDPLMDLIRRARPDVIVVSPPRADEALPLAELVFNAAYCSTIPNYRSPSGLEAASVRAPILAWDRPEALDFDPDTYVEITEQWPRKQRLVERCVEAGADEALRDLAEVASRARGVQVQVELAEAFRTERAWGRLRSYRSLP